MQNFAPAQYAGKRIRLSANIKTEGVTSWSGLWMRIDDANHTIQQVAYAVLALDFAMQLAGSTMLMFGIIGNDDHKADRVVHTAIDLGHSLGLLVVAEGVETDEQWVQLMAWGCDLVQGFRRILMEIGGPMWLSTGRRAGPGTSLAAGKIR